MINLWNLFILITMILWIVQSTQLDTPSDLTMIDQGETGNVDVPITDYQAVPDGDDGKVISFQVPFRLKVNGLGGTSIFNRALVQFYNSGPSLEFQVTMYFYEDARVSLYFWNYDLEAAVSTNPFSIDEDKWYYLDVYVCVEDMSGTLTLKAEVFADLNKSVSVVSLTKTNWQSGQAEWKSMKFYNLLRMTDLAQGEGFSLQYGAPIWYMEEADGTNIEPTVITLGERGGYSYFDRDESMGVSPLWLDSSSEAYFTAIDEPEDASVAGSYTTQTPAVATRQEFKDKLDEMWDDIITGIDDLLNMPESKLKFPQPFTMISTGFNLFYNTLIAPGFEIVTDSVINALGAVVKSGTHVAEGLFIGSRNLVADNIDDVFLWLKANLFTASMTGYHDVGPYIKSMVESLEEYAGQSVLEQIKLPYSRIYPYGLISDPEDFSLRLPTSVSLTVFPSMVNWNLSFRWMDIIMPHLLVGKLFGVGSPSSKFFLTEYLPYDLSHPTEKLRSYKYSSTGATYDEIAKDGLILGGFATATAIAAKFLPADLLAKFAIKLASSTAIHKPSIKDVLNNLGVPYDAQTFEPSGDSLWTRVNATRTQVDAILEDTATSIPSLIAAIEDKIDLIDTNVDSINSKTDIIDSNVDSVLEDTATSVPSLIAAIEDKIDLIDTNVDSVNSKTDIIDSNVDSVLVDTDVTIPASISDLDTKVVALAANETLASVISGVKGGVKTITNVFDKIDEVDSKTDIIDSNVDTVLADTGETIPASIADLDTKVTALAANETLASVISGVKGGIKTVTNVYDKIDNVDSKIGTPVSDVVAELQAITTRLEALAQQIGVKNAF